MREHAEELAKTAGSYCRRGMHLEAAELFEVAAWCYEMDDEWYSAGWATGQADGERRKIAGRT